MHVLRSQSPQQTVSSLGARTFQNAPSQLLAETPLVGTLRNTYWIKYKLLEKYQRDKIKLDSGIFLYLLIVVSGKVDHLTIFKRLIQ